MYSSLNKMKDKGLPSSTYFRIIDLCLKNNDLNYASFFMCQIDKLKLNLPRNLLDKYLELSICKDEDEVTNKNNNISINNESKINSDIINKDNISSKNRINIIADNHNKLKVSSKPYVPKKTEDFVTIDNKLNKYSSNKINLNKDAPSYTPKTIKN